MNSRATDLLKGRREFLRAAFPAGAFLCFGGPLLTLAQEKEKERPSAQPLAMNHKFLVDASAFNPKLKMIRSKTLMQGHDCCNHRYVVEG